MEKHEYKDNISEFSINAPSEWSYSVEKPVLDETGNNLYYNVGITLLPTRDDSNVIAFMRMDEGRFAADTETGETVQLNDSLEAALIDDSSESMVTQTFALEDMRYGIIIRMDTEFYQENVETIEDILASVDIK